MKPLLFAAATAAALLATAPAFSQGAPAPPPADHGTPANIMAGGDQGFRIDDPRRDIGQCFNGRSVVSASRGAGDSLYVQPKAGAVFRLSLASSCADLTAADLTAASKLTVRSAGSNVCAGAPATVKIETPAGARTCAVRMVRRLSGREVASLAGR
jgi:hypothetical protein